MSGNDWQKKKFKVQMSSIAKDNPCHTCKNNKYKGGNEEICDNCKGYAKYEPR